MKPRPIYIRTTAAASLVTGISLTTVAEIQDAAEKLLQQPVFVSQLPEVWETVALGCLARCPALGALCVYARSAERHAEDPDRLSSAAKDRLCSLALRLAGGAELRFYPMTAEEKQPKPANEREHVEALARKIGRDRIILATVETR